VLTLAYKAARGGLLARLLVVGCMGLSLPWAVRSLDEGTKQR
jgi:hypothetical protein